MADNIEHDDDKSLAQIIEEIRASKYSNIDRDLVREILRLHANPEDAPDGLARLIDEAITQRCN